MGSPINNYSSASLAYLGDCALEIYVREYLVRELSISSSAKLNKAALEFVRAPKQAEAMKKILPILNEQEKEVFKRGRNLGHSNVPKASTVAEYRVATGMEALFGWLWLEGKQERLRELFYTAYELEHKKEDQIQ